jgi:hypothetical protein
MDFVFSRLNLDNRTYQESDQHCCFPVIIWSQYEYRRTGGYFWGVPTSFVEGRIGDVYWDLFLWLLSYPSKSSHCGTLSWVVISCTSPHLISTKKKLSGNNKPEVGHLHWRRLWSIYCNSHSLTRGISDLCRALGWLLSCLCVRLFWYIVCTVEFTLVSVRYSRLG